MPTRRRRKRGRVELSDEQFWELLIGPDGRRNAFPNEVSRRTAWNLFGADLVNNWDCPGRRPWGWWQYVSSILRIPEEDERKQLERMEVTDEIEKAKLDAFDKLMQSR